MKHALPVVLGVMILSALGVAGFVVGTRKAAAEPPRVEVKPASHPMTDTEQTAVAGLEVMFSRMWSVRQNERGLFLDPSCDVARVTSDQNLQQAIGNMLYTARGVGQSETRVALSAQQARGIAGSVAAVGTLWVERKP